MITQAHIGEARLNAQKFNDFGLGQRDNFRLQNILIKLSSINENLLDNSFDIVLELREGKKIIQEDLDNLIDSISLIEDNIFYSIGENKKDIIDFLSNISDNLLTLNSDVTNVMRNTRKGVEAGL